MQVTTVSLLAIQCIAIARKYSNPSKLFRIFQALESLGLFSPVEALWHHYCSLF